MQFRPDIAGLRALAILPILFFHAGIESIPGGFVGVDIFFVISGFLITSLIVRDLEKGKFSLWRFYRRRVVRIFPALLLVILATLIAGYFLLLPSEISDLAASSVSALAFVSNFHFFFTADYFGAAAESTPLLHTWSLAVEEQFYIFYPFMLLLLWRWRPGSVRWVVLGCAILSFFVALGFAAYRPTASFYLLPARAWELGIGSLVALGMYPQAPSERARQLSSLTGLAIIIASLFFIESGALFPAPLAIFPTIGTALLIAYGKDAITARFLALPPAQWIGNVSFSLYLWHWPVITFYRLRSGNDLSLGETAALVTISLILAAATYIWLERPCLERFRQGTRLSDRFVTLSGVGSMIAMIIVSLAIEPISHSMRTFPDSVERMEAFLHYRDMPDYAYQFRRGECFMGETTDQVVNRKCLELSSEKPNLVVMGDSHAAQFWRAFAERYDSYHVIQATASGCRPLLDAKGAARCTDLMRIVFDELVPSKRIDTIVLGGRWNEDEIGPLKETVKALSRAGVSVVVIGPIVEYDGDLPVILARAIFVQQQEPYV